jgi:hypothetical protein
MPDERRHESADLTYYEVRDAYDTLDGAPGDDPLDRGVVTPDRWSSGIRLAEEDEDEESLDERLAEEEPDAVFDPDDDQPDGIGADGIGADDIGADENATEEDIARLVRAEGPDPRAGRLLADDEGTIVRDGVSLTAHDDLVARDEGIDGGAATAEEAAVHVIDVDTEGTTN